MAELWDPSDIGVLRLPSGRLVRGRGLRQPFPPGPVPTFAVYLLGKSPPGTPWESRWLRWPDFSLPSDRSQAKDILAEAWDRALNERVEIACCGGRGRTGTALGLSRPPGRSSSQPGGVLRAPTLRHPRRGDAVATTLCRALHRWVEAQARQGSRPSHGPGPSRGIQLNDSVHHHEIFRRRQQMMAQPRVRKASWMWSPISQRMRRRRNQCSRAMVASTTQR